MKWKNILVAWDFALAILAVLVSLWALPRWLSNEFAREVYQMGISVLSIVFAIFFTALAVIVSAGQDDFGRFLQERGHYKRLIASFRFTLLVLFSALAYSVLLFIITAGVREAGYPKQVKWIFVTFIGLFVYALMATSSATNDALHYARYRLEFLEIKLRRQGENSTISPSPECPADNTESP